MAKSRRVLSILFHSQKDVRNHYPTNFLLFEIFERQRRNGIFAKGQLISKCLFGVIVWTKKPTKFFPGFVP